MAFSFVYSGLFRPCLISLKSFSIFSFPKAFSNSNPLSPVANSANRSSNSFFLFSSFILSCSSFSCFFLFSSLCLFIISFLIAFTCSTLVALFILSIDSLSVIPFSSNFSKELAFSFFKLSFSCAFLISVFTSSKVDPLPIAL